MMRIILVFLGAILGITLYACCKVNSPESRKEEYEEMMNYMKRKTQ